MKRILFLGVAAAALAPAPAHAGVPSVIPFAGRLVHDGIPADGPTTISFAIFDAQTGGQSLWAETQQVTATGGLVYARLGTQTDLDPSLFDGAVFLDVTIHDGTGDHEFLPRLPLESVPFALHAATADAIGGLAPEDLQPKITGACATGYYVHGIGADGALQCAPDVDTDTDTNSGGTITGVTAGTGLTGGGTTGAVSLGVNAAVIQSRVAGVCAAGSSIRAVAQDGTVTCESDTDSGGTITGVSAGTGLTGGGSTGAVSLAVNPAAVQSRVSFACAAGSSIRAIAQDGTVTCEADDDTNSGGTITGVTASTGLTGGGTTGAVSLAVNPATVQSRVSFACAAGSSIRAIAQDGTVTCEADDDTNSGGTITGVTAGTGLTGGGTTGGVSLAVNPAAVQSRVTGSCGAGQAVRAIAQDGTVTCEPKASRTLLGTAPLTFTTYSGTPSGWTQISYESFSLQDSITNAAEFVKPGQTVQGRLCAFYTDSYAGSSAVHFRIRHRDNTSIVYYALDLPSTWANAQLSLQRCGPWVDASVLNACTGNFAQGTCSLDLKHDANAYTVIYNLQLQLAAVN
jgi:hypothetical protein